MERTRQPRREETVVGSPLGYGMTFVSERTCCGVFLPRKPIGVATSSSI